MKPQYGEQLIGAVLHDSYRILRMIGAGGMGTVYEGLQVRLGKRVAVKILAPDLNANPKSLARFHREAQITSQLGHPHIVNVFDFGVASSGEPYMVMELLEGEDLEHRLRLVGRLDLPSALRIVRQTASALAATHGQGVIHRDLKPANIFLLRATAAEDFVKVVDFGISKAKDAATLQTRDFTLVGTPQYMSPEQATGRKDEIDHRTDQWALACIMYEMLQGYPVFRGEEAISILYQVVHVEPPPLNPVMELPSELEQVLRKALSKSSADRFESISAFSRALHEAAGPQYLNNDPTPSPVTVSHHPGAVRDRTPMPAPVRPIELQDGKTGESIIAPTARIRRGKRIWAATAAIGAVLLVVAASLLLRKPTVIQKPAGTTPGTAPSTVPTIAAPRIPAPAPGIAPPAVEQTKARGLAKVAEKDLNEPEAKGRIRGHNPAKTPSHAAGKLKEINEMPAPPKQDPMPVDDVGF